MGSVNDVIRMSRKALVNVARYMSLNFDYIKRFNQLMTTHVVGESGPTLRAVYSVDGKNPAQGANRQVESRWREFGRKGVCEVTRTMNFVDFCRVTLNKAMNDGEAFVKIIEGAGVNEFGFSLQLIDSLACDDELNQKLSGGGEIRSGIEFNDYGAPVAYYFIADRMKNPASVFVSTMGRAYIRVPAREIIHVYFKIDHPQDRGIPWTYAALLRSRNIKDYDLNEIIASQVASCQGGFFERENKDQFEIKDIIKIAKKGKSGELEPIDSAFEKKKETGELVQYAEPATFTELPPGYSFKAYTPTHPTTEYAGFMKEQLRALASALGLSSTTLSNNASDVNFSSARSQILEERDYYKVIQEWYIETLIRPVYDRWLNAAILTGKVNLDPRFVTYDGAYFQPKRWAWVDPLKDANATIAMINAGLKSRAQAAKEQGFDWEDVAQELSLEEKLMEKYGIKLEKKATEKGKVFADETQEEIEEAS
jgi:lambda family phage portal protein